MSIEAILSTHAGYATPGPAGVYVETIDGNKRLQFHTNDGNVFMALFTPQCFADFVAYLRAQLPGAGAVFIVERSYPYTGEGPDELCVCSTHEGAVDEIKRYIRRNEYNGAGVKMPKKKWKRINPDTWHWKSELRPPGLGGGYSEEYIGIRKEMILP